MSIYFQYPSINEYQNIVYPLKTEKIEMQKIIDEDRINQEHFDELKDFLALKPV
ncbi:hypothetical protein [Pedobacter jamesrossensis]|uniref:Uncharacterized protein n=1 Tax=Pedobacter jamesrossensis TaxID=1908238 RepID=A0ABV8NIE9_9SPHI